MTQKAKDQNHHFGPIACTALVPLLICALPFGLGAAFSTSRPSSDRKVEVINLLKSLETRACEVKSKVSKLLNQKLSSVARPRSTSAVIKM